MVCVFLIPAEKQISLEKPEFEGLWNQQTKPYKVPKDNDQLLNKPVGKSLMEKVRKKIFLTTDFYNL